MAKQRKQSPAFNPVTGQQLQGVDQAAIQAQDRMRSPRGINESWESHEKDWDAIHKISKRGTRGGGIFREEDMMGVPPRPKPEHHR